MSFEVTKMTKAKKSEMVAEMMTELEGLTYDFEVYQSVCNWKAARETLARVLKVEAQLKAVR